MERRSTRAGAYCGAERLASASIAPWRMWAAASASTFSPRLSRRTRRGRRSAPPNREPPVGIAPDRRPEQRIIVDMVVVAREHVRSKRRYVSVQDQQPLVAMGADHPRLEARR